MIYNIEGDSGDYEFLTEAVQLSKVVKGACLEIGNRRGMGLKTIADAMREFCPTKTLIGVDPYGHLEYEHREGQICRLDYTNQMKLEGMAAVFTYLAEFPVNFVHINLTDTDFFNLYKDGVPIYELERTIETKYSMVHLDGPHGGDAILEEIKFFDLRTRKGAVIVIDDVSEDFIDIKPIDEWMSRWGWIKIKEGNKKAIYQKSI